MDSLDSKGTTDDLDPTDFRKGWRTMTFDNTFSGIRARGDHLIFEEADNIENLLERQLKDRYSKGIFIHDIRSTESGGKLIQVGVAYAKDVSDRRDEDRVMKLINVGNIETINAEPLDKNHYKAELPDRDELYDEFRQRRLDIVSRLDWATANTIYE
ncbi:MAG: hypothetical protein ABEI86_10175, partial [Halobacteriaceae archaeon]